MITANLTGYLGYNQELVFRNVKSRDVYYNSSSKIRQA